jgi:hypothetical protein
MSFTHDPFLNLTSTEHNEQRTMSAILVFVQHAVLDYKT